MKKKNTPKISVIIPIYNSEKYLEECLYSVLNQSLKSIEVICVNDESTDHSLDILEKIKSKDSRIKIVSIKHKNAGVARNEGMKIAKGEYLSFLDSDDYFERNALEKMYKAAKSEKGIDIVVAKSKQFKNNKKNFEKIDWSIRQELLPANNPFNISEIKEDVFCVFMGWAWDKLFRNQFVKNNNFEFQSLAKQNDGYFVFCSLLRAKKIYIVDDFLLYHRKHKRSLETLDNINSNYLCHIKMLTSIQRKLKEWNIYEQYKRDFINFGLCISKMISNGLKVRNKKKLYSFLKKEGFLKLDIKEYRKEYYYRMSDYYYFIEVMYGKRKKIHKYINENGLIFTIKKILFHFHIIKDEKQ